MQNRSVLLLTITIISCSLLDSSHYQQASALASQFLSSPNLQQIFESSASNGTTSNGTTSNGTTGRSNFSSNSVLKTNPIKISIPSGANYATPKVSIPAARRESPAIDNPARVVPNPSPTQLGTNLTSQYPHLNQNNLFQDLPPTADAGPAQVVSAGSTVVLNGSNSKASNDKIASYSCSAVKSRQRSNIGSL